MQASKDTTQFTIAFYCCLDQEVTNQGLASSKSCIKECLNYGCEIELCWVELLLLDSYLEDILNAGQILLIFNQGFLKRWNGAHNCSKDSISVWDELALNHLEQWDIQLLCERALHHVCLCCLT